MITLSFFVSEHYDELGTTSSSKLQFPVVMSGSSYGYKNIAGTFVAFRKPTGTATAAQVLSGYSFSNASSDSVSGNIPIRPAGTYATLTGRNNVAAFAYIPYGYYENASATYGQYVYLTDAQVQAMGVGGDTKHSVLAQASFGSRSDNSDIGELIVRLYVDGALVSSNISNDQWKKQFNATINTSYVSV